MSMIDVLLIEQPEFDEPLRIINRILQLNREAPSLQALCAQVGHKEEDQDFILKGSLLLYCGRLVILDLQNARIELIREAYDQVSIVYSGQDKTHALLCSYYYWRDMLPDIERYIRNCHVCRRAYIPRDNTPGFLYPLPIPVYLWQYITMDFKSTLKDKHGYDTVWVAIDRLSKQAVSVPCYKTVIAEQMARMYIMNVYRYYGPLESIVSDRGPQFVSSFQKKFCRILGTKVKLSIAFYPQTDGQTEIMNQYLDQRLRPFVNYYQDNWSELLPLMDYTQFTLPHSSIWSKQFANREQRVRGSVRSICLVLCCCSVFYK